ncbi:hypothetical protein MSIBF_A2300002 [groundwater metagenome]|uniref:Transcription initiation factor IIB n=1 Tax=groundwater metagenome TaxID=717931 RepID=A0A098E8U7_9ZZZZ
MNLENFPERVDVELLLKLAEYLRKDDVAPIGAKEVAEVIAKNFDNIPENIRNELLLKLAKKESAAKAIARVVADKFDAIPENIRNDLLFKLAEKDSAAREVASAIAYNFNKLPENVRNLLFKLADNESAASEVAHVAVHNKFNKIDDDVRYKLLLKLAEKDNITWEIACIFADKFNKLPENIMNELLLKTANKRMISLYVKWINEFKNKNDSIYRNLSVALPELDRMCSLLELGETITEDCTRLYRQAADKGFATRISIKSIIGAIIHYVTKSTGEPRTLEEIAEKSGISKAEIGRTYKNVIRSMNLKQPKTNIESYIAFYASKLGISNAAKEELKRMFKVVKKTGINSGKGPSGFVGAAIFLACERVGEKCKKKEIIRVVKTTPATLDLRYKEIKNEIENLEDTGNEKAIK